MKKFKQSRALIFRNTQAPGDLMMMTAAIRDLHRCYPQQFITDVDTTAKEVWDNNPYITKLNSRSTQVLKLGYPLIHQSNQSGLHFIQGFIDDINKKLKLRVRLTEFRPDLHWSKKELDEPLVRGNYWVIISGGKADFTTKWWDPVRYQEVVDSLEGKINFVQIGGKPAGGGARHFHPPLNNVINLVGKTNLREAFRICLHARGILTPVTCFMHLGAALAKPTVVIAGGREHYTWEAYTAETLRRNMSFAAGLIPKLPGNQQQWDSWQPANDNKFKDHPFVEQAYLHTIGQLRCCKLHGCWKTRVTEGKPEQNCSDVVCKPGRVPLPRCLDAITVNRVVEELLRFEKLIYGMEHDMSAVKDLVVEIKEATAPPPEQDPNPIVKAADNKICETSEETRRSIKPKNLHFKHLTFPITIFGLTYGDHGDLAVRCLSSIYRYLDPTLFRLRYALNEPSKKAYDSVLSFLSDKSNVDRVYEASPQIFKYPMMRKMFYDPEMPINTDWLMWFDDDSHIVDRNWIIKLGQKVDEVFLKQDERYPNGFHMFGKVYYFHLRGNQWDWMKQADWYTGRPLNKDNSKRPPMEKSDFCTGGFWLVTKKAVEAANWPDKRLRHRGGDIWMGIALQQQGFGVSQAHQGVLISDARQRGYNENIAGI